MVFKQQGHAAFKDVHRRFEAVVGDHVAGGIAAAATVGTLACAWT